MREVTAAIIIKDNKVLIAQRAPGQKMSGKWEFPGGKTEEGETLEECLKREIFEELDIQIEVLGKFGENIFKYDMGTIKLIAFNCQWVSGEIELSVHSQIKWVSGAEFDQYDFAPADIPFVERLKLK
jgi:8-oxo-dGTP diphosphatase